MHSPPQGPLIRAGICAAALWQIKASPPTLQRAPPSEAPDGKTPSKAPPPSLQRAPPRAPSSKAHDGAPQSKAPPPSLQTVPHHALAPTQGQPAVLFTLQDAQKLRGTLVGTATANTWIKNLRLGKFEPGGAVDLEDAELPWRPWISNLPEMERIVGEGVVAIEYRRRKGNALDTLAEIVVTRFDGTSMHRPFCLSVWLSEDGLPIDEHAASAASTGGPLRAARLGTATSDYAVNFT